GLHDEALGVSSRCSAECLQNQSGWELTEELELAVAVRRGVPKGRTSLASAAERTDPVLARGLAVGLEQLTPMRGRGLERDRAQVELLLRACLTLAGLLGLIAV